MMRGRARQSRPNNRNDIVYVMSSRSVSLRCQASLVFEVDPVDFFKFQPSCCVHATELRFLLFYW